MFTLPIRFSGITINGKYFENETKLIFFPKENQRISIIYGKNGSGKSTIAKAYSAYKYGELNYFNKVDIINSDGSPALLSDEDKQNIFVFDEKYIENNIRLQKDGLNTIVMLGEQVDLDKQIKVLEDDIKSCTKSKEKQENECEKYKAPTNPLSPIFYYEAIKTTLKESNGWAEIDSNIRGNKVNSSVTDSVIKEIANITTQKPLSELQMEFCDKYSLFKQINNNQTKYSDKINTINTDKDIDSKILSLLSKIIDKPKLTARENGILDAIIKGSQNLIEAAKNTFSNESTKMCPYCYQTVSKEYKAELIDSIEKVLNEDVEEHKAELEATLIKTIEYDETKYSKLDCNQIEKVKNAIKLCNDIIEKYNTKIKEKLSNIYTPISLTSLQLSENITAANNELEKLENERITFNKAIDEKNIIKNHLIDLNKQITFYNIESNYNSYKIQTQEKQAEDKKLSDIVNEMGNKSKRLEELNQKKKSIKIALDYINKALEYVFFCKDRLTLSEENDIYYLKSYGKPVKPSDISKGECNIIALCYFFTYILNNLSEKDAYKKRFLLIIDDPVSSFDLENRVGIQSYLKFEMQKILLGNKDSKIILLSHDLNAVNDFEKSAKEICNSAKGHFKVDTKYEIFELKNKLIKPFKLLEKQQYTLLMEMVYRYAMGDNVNENEIIIGNAMRRILEAFSTFEYREGIEEVSCDKEILDSLEEKKYHDYFENLMYRIVLNGESHYRDTVITLPDMNFFDHISSEEKVRTAKDILCYMYLLNQHHIESHLSNITGATDNIKKWCEAILSS